MNEELAGRAPASVRLRNGADAHKRREAEANDAMDFLFLGDEHGRHAERCVHGEPCSRTYDPIPYPEAVPVDSRMYEGTGIGALYGLPDTDRHLWQLAGWNLAPRSTR